ncbi:hypothetical protein CYMTET_4002 [Cymbomonas tetramitiformis]|uniref:GDT1 family protein n=1 Tax=Cymbomonas tetramitiformis TaxID=36881 RepID=A0AAE0LKA0_9CHLO|nr:hypothetical protein CYMTET_4002 [Cymbomonas tetramitiformis]|eukprot:gene14998-17728_t
MSEINALPNAEAVEELSSEVPNLSAQASEELVQEEMSEAADELKEESEALAGEAPKLMDNATDTTEEPESIELDAESNTGTEGAEKDTGFWTGFIRSYLVIIVIEIGDRTFFIAALLGIKYNQVKVFLGAFSALAFMTVVSTALGVAAPMLLPRWFTHYAATVLFGFFGGQLLWKAYNMVHTGASEELGEVEEELASKGSNDNSSGQLWQQFVNSVYVQAFTMTAIAEWGDRSQIATIAMAADYDPYGITVGGSLGHGCATAFAVASGRAIAARISEKMITYMGGSVFMLFAVLAFFEDPDEDMSKSIPSWMTSWASSS